MKPAFILIALVAGTSILLSQSPKPSQGGFQTDLSGSHFQQVTLAKTLFEESDLSKTTFRSINLTGATLKSCNLSDVDISASNLSGMKIDGVLVTDLQKAYQDAKKK